MIELQSPAASSVAAPAEVQGAARLKLHRISVYVETEDEDDVTVDRLSDAFQQAICPFPATEPHTCPNRWMVISSEVPEDELEELGDLDEFLNS